ncbi:MAG: lamin tail domain-containing protein [Bacteroidales bacterium]
MQKIIMQLLFHLQRAEYEFYSIAINSDLVINEFMADNETTVEDQDGEYDDWIEFYNNGSEEISLSGYYLSDNAADPSQWVFPDTTIAGGGYLIVWADNDEEQEGLHANFKLSSSGEAILLSNAGLSIIDEVSYGQQYADTTTGRFPNGTGDFVLMNPTFEMENESGTTAVNELQQDDLFSFLAYPNPFSDKLNLEFSLDTKADIFIRFHNIYGQLAKVVSGSELP